MAMDGQHGSTSGLCAQRICFCFPFSWASISLSRSIALSECKQSTRMRNMINTSTIRKTPLLSIQYPFVFCQNTCEIRETRSQKRSKCLQQWERKGQENNKFVNIIKIPESTNHLYRPFSTHFALFHSSSWAIIYKCWYYSTMRARTTDGDGDNDEPANAEKPHST